MEAELLPSLLQLSAYGTPLALSAAYWKLAKPISSRQPSAVMRVSQRGKKLAPEKLWPKEGEEPG